MNLEELKRKIDNNKKITESILSFYDSNVQSLDNSFAESLQMLGKLEELSADIEQFKGQLKDDEKADFIKQLRAQFDLAINECTDNEFLLLSRGIDGSNYIQIITQAIIENKIESLKKNTIEKYENQKFLFSCTLPLYSILSINILNENDTNLLLANSANYDPYKTIHSLRDLYHYILQLPDHLANFSLNIICSDNDYFSIIDAYQQKDEDSFINAFESLKDKSSIIEEIVLYAKMWYLYVLCLEDDHLKDYTIEELEVLSAVSQDIRNSERRLPHLKTTNYFDDIIEHGWSKQDIIKLHKHVLLEYLKEEKTLDGFIKLKANKILQNPMYREINEKLLAECKKDIEQHDKNGATTTNITIEPIAFPDSISVSKKKRSAFLNELFNKLEQKYVDENQRINFIYLLGGGTNCPENLTRINWKKEKNKLQAFCRAYLGITENVPWSTLNHIFTINGKEAKLANSSGNKTNQGGFETMIKEAVTKTE